MEKYRIETKKDIEDYLVKLRYAIDSGAKLIFQIDRVVDKNRDEKYTNRYTVAHLFPNENPETALKREIGNLTTKEYIRTVKDLRFPQRSEMREFGRK